MQNLLCAAALSLAATGVSAAGFDTAPVTPVEVVAEETVTASGAYQFLPFVLAVVLGALAASN